ncbi:MAG: A24 family peptidase [Chloroflexi bacterium]|nr:A24 family peptidase [Chloroflexota bacterium]
MLFLILVVGLLSGLVVNYLADVLPATRRLAKPDWWPLSGGGLAGYFSRPRVLIVIALSLSAAFLIFQFPPTDFPVYLFSSVLVYFFIVAVIDIEHRVVMHPVSIAGSILMGGIGIWRHGWLDTLIGGAVGFGFMLAIYHLGDWLGRLMARMRKEPWEETALGFGDVNLAGVIGLLMGWPAVIAALFVGMLAAGLFSGGYLLVAMVKGKYQAFASIPYAPFLCLGAVVMVAVGIYLG